MPYSYDFTWLSHVYHVTWQGLYPSIVVPLWVLLNTALAIYTCEISQTLTKCGTQGNEQEDSSKHSLLMHQRDIWSRTEGLSPHQTDQRDFQVEHWGYHSKTGMTVVLIATHSVQADKPSAQCTNRQYSWQRFCGRCSKCLGVSSWWWWGTAGKQLISVPSPSLPSFLFQSSFPFQPSSHSSHLPVPAIQCFVQVKLKSLELHTTMWGTPSGLLLDY